MNGKPGTADAERLRLLREVLAFPDVLAPFTLPALAETLEMQWYELQESVLPDIAMYPGFGLNDYLDLLANSWDAVLEFYNAHYATLRVAHDEFRRHARRLARMRIATLAEYPKHYVPLGTSTNDIVALVQRDHVSRFLPAISPDNLTRLLHITITERFDQLWRGETSPFDVDAQTPVGVSLQGPTTCVRFDCDFNTPLAHGYPIPYDDAALEIEPGILCVANTWDAA